MIKNKKIENRLKNDLFSIFYFSLSIPQSAFVIFLP